MEKILSIKSVSLVLEKSEPPRLNITAYGVARTPRYTEPTLIPYVYVMPPPDGIYDFDFVATPPGDIVNQMLTPITATETIENIPEGLNGVRIHASTNAVVALLGENSSGTVCVRGTLSDEGVECQALRGENGELYTLVGDLGGYSNGDNVIVCGAIADISFCMQGTTINVSWIGSEVPRAR